MPFKTSLDAAIAHLISKGVVKSYADVARDLGLSGRSTVSNYANGVHTISKNFKTLFETHYGVRLEDFKQGNAEPDQTGDKSESIKDEMIVLQRKQIELHEKYAALLEINSTQKVQERMLQISSVLQQIASSLNAGLYQVRENYALARAVFLRSQTHFALTEKKKESEVAKDMDKLYAEALAGSHGLGIQ